MPLTLWDLVLRIETNWCTDNNKVWFFVHLVKNYTYYIKQMNNNNKNAVLDFASYFEGVGNFYLTKLKSISELNAQSIIKT